MSKDQISEGSAFPSSVEPIESWQIIAVERIDEDDEPDRWGADGRNVVAWFDLGEAREQIETHFDGAARFQEQRQERLSRLLTWFRTVVFGAPRYRLVEDPT